MLLHQPAGTFEVIKPLSGNVCLRSASSWPVKLCTWLMNLQRTSQRPVFRACYCEASILHTYSMIFESDNIISITLYRPTMSGRQCLQHYRLYASMHCSCMTHAFSVYNNISPPSLHNSDKTWFCWKCCIASADKRPELPLLILLSTSMFLQNLLLFAYILFNTFWTQRAWYEICLNSV